ncbi:MAG: hypothetical protein ACI8XM_003001 [Haloarculaceae archaeon]|jgi:hypothetical protein
MSDEVQPGLSDQYRKASPWPLFVALGFVISEVGIILGFFPVAVGGLLLFGGTVAGILTEAGYITRPGWSLGVFGVVLGAFGLATVGLNIDPAALRIGVLLDVLLDPANPFVYRGSAIAVAGLILIAMGLAVVVVQLLDSEPT